jgi:hypothetical protein
MFSVISRRLILIFVSDNFCLEEITFNKVNHCSVKTWFISYAFSRVSVNNYIPVYVQLT